MIDNITLLFSWIMQESECFFLSMNTTTWHLVIRLGATAQSDARPPGMWTVGDSILTSGKTFFRCDLVMKKISMTILSLLLIQEGQLSVTGERMCAKYW